MPLKAIVVTNRPSRENAGNRFDDANSNSFALLLKNGGFCRRGVLSSFW